MSADADDFADMRAELLEPVKRRCDEAGLEVTVGDFHPRDGDRVRALLCGPADRSWDAMITVIRGRRRPEEWRYPGGEYERDPVTGYRLDSDGQLLYELQIHEDGGDSGRGIKVFRLAEYAEAAVDELILWARRPALFRCAPPVLDPRRRQRQELRQFEHREAAAAAARVVVLDQAGAAIDDAALCWNFPREASGRYLRSAVVALTHLGDRQVANARTPWLAARAEGETLVVDTDRLFGANQRHRWNLTPWLWDARHGGARARERWQVDDPSSAAPVVESLSRGAVAEALTRCGVRVDESLANLLAGIPARLSLAEYTQKWVTSLSDGLAGSAPWRFAAAYGAWRDERRSFDLPAAGPVVLFGLKGMKQARKPKVALDEQDGTPILRLIFSGSNAVLPDALWKLPPDLAAAIHGWRPAIGAGGRRRVAPSGHATINPLDSP